MIRAGFAIAFLGVLSLAASGCGSDSGDGSGGGSGGGTGNNSGGTNSSGGGGNGTSQCGDQTCQAGQYCFNGICVNGCLTSANCLPTQTCEDIDEFSGEGTCKDKPATPTKDCDAFCEKAVVCQAPEADMCMQICAAISTQCANCVIDSNCSAGCDDECEF